ncbi:MAG: CDP-alcohol phosphatidyltransferase family protein [Acidimicrobiales bacterium]
MSQPTATTVSGFAGDRKHGQSILGPLERRFIDHWVQRFPGWIRSWQLTLLTVVWSAGTITFGWLAGDRPVWLWAMSVMVAAQWFTDSFDGTLGRTRGEGLVKWGFFMDHFLDTVFAGSVVIGYSFIAPGGAGLLLQLLLLVTCSMMALSFLSFAATNQFQIAFYGVGPTEVRIGYIALNTFVFFAGPKVFWWGLPLVLALNLTVLALLVYRTHCKLWALDKAALAAARDGSDRGPRG